MEPDFSGYATKNDLKCSDGRVIKANAFVEDDKKKVPLVYHHQHHDPMNILGHALLENREDGVYAYGFFNKTPAGQAVKEAVKNGDVNSLSIFADRITQRGTDVVHGSIKEVSIVLAGANPGAIIDNVVISHGDDVKELEDEVVIHSGLLLEDSDTQTEGDTVATATDTKQENENTKEDPDLKGVYESMTDEQKDFVKLVAAKALESAEADEEDEDDEDEENKDSKSEDIKHSDLNQEDPMARNVFDQTKEEIVTGKTLTHSQLQTIVEDAKVRYNGSVKTSFLAHAQEYGIENIDILFPDAKNLTSSPEFLKRRTEWVADVLGSVKATPHAKVKTVVADITADEARARGYVKGSLKKDEVIQLLKRSTGPTTIYKKQRLDRDDMIDITDLDVVAWLKAEMRLMLDEELARAILIGDGRGVGSEDKIKDPAGALEGDGIRAIVSDSEFYAHKVSLASNISVENGLEQIIRARSAYKGSGSPAFYTTDSWISDVLLLKDKVGRRIYSTLAEVASAIRVDRIVAVEVMETKPELVGVMVNLRDYSLGTNKGGATAFFDDFDIDYNQYKYLIETRLSGALTKPKSALVVTKAIGEAATPTSPSFNGETGVVTIPTVTGVDYYIDSDVVTGEYNVPAGTSVDVDAVAAEGYYIPANTVTSWSFTNSND